jgi:hypothetical protein
MSKEFTVLVPKGYRVNVQESDNLSEGDSRIGSDRNLVVKGGADLKIAISRGGTAAAAGASVVTMCG